MAFKPPKVKIPSAKTTLQGIQNPMKAMETNIKSAPVALKGAAVGGLVGGLPGAAIGALAGDRMPAQVNQLLTNPLGMAQKAGTDIANVFVPEAVGSINPLISQGTGDTGRAFAQYVESLKAQAPLSPFMVSQIQSQQIADKLGTESAFAPQQAQIAQLLMERAQGRGGPSPAELMLAQQQDKIRSMALAQAASTSGRAMGAVGRQIGQQQALGAQEAMRNAAILRAQETQQAGMDAAKALEMGRTGELALRGQQQAALTADQQAELEAQKSQATLGLQAQADAARLSEARQQALLQASQAGLEDQRMRDLQQQKLQSDIAMAEFQAKEAAKQAEADRRMRIAGAAIAGASDAASKFILGGGK